MTKEIGPLAELFLHEKPIRILISLKTGDDPNYASTLAKDADCTYSHTVKILNAFLQAGLVEFKKSGRIKFVRLTDAGEDFAHDFESVIRKFTRLTG